MNEDLLRRSQEEYLRQLNEHLTSNKKKPISKETLDELIKKYLEGEPER